MAADHRSSKDNSAEYSHISPLFLSRTASGTARCILPLPKAPPLPPRHPLSTPRSREKIESTNTPLISITDSPQTSACEIDHARSLPTPATDQDIAGRELWELELLAFAQHSQNKDLYELVHREAMKRWRQAAVL